MFDITDYKVLVRCMTYNQSRYIEDALNGFAMQRTSFPFVCLVMDDASTDGEQEVIKSFLDRSCDMSQARQYDIEEASIVIAEHKSNHNCSFAVYFLKKNLYRSLRKIKLIEGWRNQCKYEALCEGDDFWFDENKLQKQISFLDNHPDHVMCTTRLRVFNENEGKFSDNLLPIGVTDSGLEYTQEDCLAGAFYFHAQTLVHRLDVEGLKKYLRCKSGFDRVLAYYLLSDGGKGYCLPDVTACYRKNNGGIWAFQSGLKRFGIVADAAMAVYENTPDKNAARFMYMNLSAGISREWIIHNIPQFFKMLAIMFKELGFKPCAKIIWNNVILGR